MEFIARFPFSKEAQELVREESVTIEELAYDPLLAPARMIARKKLEYSAFGKVYDEVDILKPMNEVYGLIIARLIVESSGDPLLRNMLAEHESKRFMNVSQQAPRQDLLSLAENTFDMDVLSDGEDVLVAIPDYLRFASGFGGPSWKLVNRRIRGGRVILTLDEFRRLLAEAVRSKLSKPEKAPDLPSPLAEIRDEILTIISARKKRKRIKRGKKDLPPCIKKLLDDLSKGENLPHKARFALAVYLLKCGYSEDEVVDIFRAAPDFNEKVTKYQVSQIARKGYRPPGCERLRSWGLCLGDECEIYRGGRK